MHQNAQIQQQQIAALPELTGTNIQHNYDYMSASIYLFAVTNREDFLKWLEIWRPYISGLEG